MRKLTKANRARLGKITDELFFLQGDKKVGEVITGLETAGIAIGELLATLTEEDKDDLTR